MPVNAFNGTHGWGYDGVLWYAVHEPYGGPDGLVRLVDACHAPRARRADRRGVQPPRPVGQLPAAVRPVPVLGEQPVGRGRQPRRRRRRRGARATSSTARCAGCATSTPTVCGWTPCTRWSTPPRSTSSRSWPPKPTALSDGSGPPAVADRRERPQRPAADHPARSRRLRADRAVGRRHPPRHPHRGVRRTAGLLRRLRLAGHAGARRCSTATSTPAPTRRSGTAGTAGRWTRRRSRPPGCWPTPAPTTRSATAPSATGRRRTWTSGQLADQGRAGARIALHRNAFHGRGMGLVDARSSSSARIPSRSWPRATAEGRKAEFAEHGWDADDDPRSAGPADVPALQAGLGRGRRPANTPGCSASTAN